MSKLAVISISAVAVLACCLPVQAQQIVINELMYSPRDSVSEAAEYLELLNPGSAAVDLSGWSFSSGVKLTFPAGSSISAGQYLVIARDKTVFRQVYGFDPHFVYSGKLDDGGELVRLVNGSGTVVDEVEYSDEPPWPVLPDGLGPSLEVIDPLADNSTPRNWRAAYSSGRSPGTRNTVFANGLPPWITKVDFKKRPNPNEAVEVSATAIDAIAALLVYRVDSGSEHTLSMAASGPSTEGTVYKATIQGQPAGSLVRLRVQVLGSNGGQNGYPRFDDTILNTGYFIEDSSLSTQLPVIHWFIDPSRYELALQHAHTDLTEPAALVYNGEVYDSVQCRVRGGSARWWPKLHWKFIMPKAHDFDMGSRLARTVDRFNLQGSYSDKTYLREILSWESFQEAGVPSNQMFHVRVHHNNKFFGLYLFLEQPDDDWLARHGLSEEAAHYKASEQADGSATDTPAELVVKYEKESRESEDYSDLWEFLKGVNSKDGETRRRYLFDHMDIPAMVNYLAVNAIIHNNDHITKNYYLYRDTEGTGRWTMYPWDMDLTFGRNYLGAPEDQYGLVLNDTIWADVDVIPGREDVSPGHPVFGDSRHQKWDFLWNRIIDALFQEADIRQMYFRRLRTLMDLLLVSGKYENRIYTLLPLFQFEAQQDRERWGQYGEEQGLGEAINHLTKDYLPARRQHLFVTHKVPGEIPEAQSTAPRVVINEIMYAPAQGTDDEFVELFNCSWDESVDLSGWKVDEIGLTIPAGTVILPREYVVFTKNDPRFRQTYGSGLLMAGQYNGSLPDSGATLSLANHSGSVVDSFTYSNQPPWPATGASSLERIDPDKADVQASNWASSSKPGGTPCAANSVAHAASFRSFIPLFTGSPWLMAAVAVSNAGTLPTSVEFTARGTDGTMAGSETVNPAKRQLPANGQLAELSTELLPGVGSPGWVEIRGENKRLSTLQILGGASQLDGGPGIATASKTIYLAPVFSGSAVFRGKDADTCVNLANPNPQPVTVRLRLWREANQTVPSLQVDKTIAPLGMFSTNVSDLFGSAQSLSLAYITVQVVEGDGIVASHWVEVSGGSSLFCVPTQYPATSTRLFSAQFASLPNLFTEVILLNQAQSARAVTAKVWSESGGLLGQTLPITVAAGSMVRLDGRAMLNLAASVSVVGSLEVQADGPGLTGCVIFGDLPDVSVAAALPLQSEPFFREAVFSHLANGAGYYTGLAFYNPGQAPVSVRLTVFDHQAVKTGETELTLQGKARKSALLHELVPSTAGQVKGFVHLVASGPVIAQQVFADTTTPRMSAVPPTGLR